MRLHLEIAEELIKEHEGLRLKPYMCPAGKLTIGYGRNLEDRGISNAEAEYLIANDILACESDLKRFPYWNSLSAPQKAALLDMRFNLGGHGFRSFKRMQEALEAGDYDAAADEILDSKYATQVGKRARTVAGLIRSRN